MACIVIDTVVHLNTSMIVLIAVCVILFKIENITFYEYHAC
jgi:hypothetical protein